MLDLILPKDPDTAAMVVHTRQLLLQDPGAEAEALLNGPRDNGSGASRLDYTEPETLDALRVWLERRVRKDPAFDSLLGSDPVLLHALALGQQQATSAPDLSKLSPVLIQGPTGCGKELLARAIHRASGVKGAFVPVHCAGITETLLETTLFGHVPGAFTGAGTKEMPGLVDEAKGGTLFLDELGDLPMRAQITLLRFLQDQRYRRVGSTQEIQGNVRVICATWQDLDNLADDGDFREDLLYRLAGARIRLPGLRDRRHELVSVAEQMLRRAGIRGDVQMDDQVRLALEHTAWPGGFRQLDMELKEAARQSEGGLVRLRHLPSHRVAEFHRQGQAVRLASELLAWGPDGAPPDDATTHRRAERAVELVKVPGMPNDPEVGLLRSVQSAFEEQDRPHQLITRVVELVDDQRRLGVEQETIHEILLLLPSLDLPPLVERQAELEAQQERIRSEMEALSSEITVRLPGLFQLFRLVEHLPGLGSSERAQLFRSFANIIHLFMMLMPTFAAAGIKRVASSTVEDLLLEGDHHDPNNPFLEDMKPERRPETHWRWLATNTGSLREAAEVSGHSRNTVKTYYERYQLTALPAIELHEGD